jgi:hypothetical protein
MRLMIMHETRTKLSSHSVSPCLAEDRGRPRDRLHDELESGSASRELILVPNRGVPPGSGPTYPVRADEFSQRHDAAYYQEPPPSPKVTGRRLLLGIGILSQAAIVILAGAALYVAMGGHGALPSAFQSLLGTGTQQLPVKAAASTTNMPVTTTEASPDSSAALATASIAPAMLAFPRPTAYGIYAISNSRLIELEQIATSSVDPRARSTLQIVKPTRTIITDPKLTFVAFRRDLVSSAPDKVPVRIAARIAKRMTFDESGKAVTAPPPTDTWLIRDQGYDLRISPVRDTPEMVIMRPDSEDFSFPSGRYELLLGAQSYDFVIAGLITDPAQCVEGIATPRGPAFYECRAQ